MVNEVLNKERLVRLGLLIDALNSGSGRGGTLEILSRDKSFDRLRASRRTGIEYQSSFYFCETPKNEKGNR